MDRSEIYTLRIATLLLWGICSGSLASSSLDLPAMTEKGIAPLLLGSTMQRLEKSDRSIVWRNPPARATAGNTMRVGSDRNGSSYLVGYTRTGHSFVIDYNHPLPTDFSSNDAFGILVRLKHRFNATRLILQPDSILNRCFIFLDGPNQIAARFFIRDGKKEFRVIFKDNSLHEVKEYPARPTDDASGLCFDLSL